MLPGRVIFNNANTYRGGTIVAAGSLNIRDSRGLGQQFNTLPPPAPVSNVDVRSGASLELEVDQGLDGTAQRTHNRNLGFDSVMGTGPGQEISVSGLSGTFTLSFKGQTTAPLSVVATAVQIENALNSLSTITAGGGSVSVTQVGTIFRVVFNGALAIGNQPLIAATGKNGTSVVVSPIYSLTVSNVLQAAGLGATMREPCAASAASTPTPASSGWATRPAPRSVPLASIATRGPATILPTPTTSPSTTA